MPNNTLERTVEHRGPRLAATRAAWLADLLMILSAAPFLLWCLVLGAVWFRWQLPDTTIGMIFVAFGTLAYLIVILVGGGSALWAIRHARSLVLPLHPSSRRLIVALGFLLAFPWVAFPIHFLIGILRAW